MLLVPCRRLLGTRTNRLSFFFLAGMLNMANDAILDLSL